MGWVEENDNCRKIQGLQKLREEIVRDTLHGKYKRVSARAAIEEINKTIEDLYHAGRRHA